MPIDSTMPAFRKVARMPEAWPLSAGTEFMMAVVFGGVKTPMPTPFRKIRKANAQ